MKNNVSNMKCLDLFLSSLNEGRNSNSELIIKPVSHQKKMLLSWGIQDLFEGNTLTKDLYKIQELIKKYDWESDIAPILHKNYYQTLVVTNTDKKIVWVNDGFKKMTGYEREFAIDKTPSFLQGRKTSEVVKKKIRENILANKPFKGTVINYRKDKMTYKCELKIFPLFSKTKATHFLALEREVV
ncbi:PAS domain-containing protein [Tenacibaculum piscium]|uniref:PAS domain-containing protein n=1 Tax=Tenacibaculum piscium TaxID=1458515 RepID=UPI001F176822|nr:PAS domain-containing protein [Tenacibaculum piscium]